MFKKRSVDHATSFVFFFSFVVRVNFSSLCFHESLNQIKKMSRPIMHKCSRHAKPEASAVAGVNGRMLNALLADARLYCEKPQRFERRQRK